MKTASLSVGMSYPGVVSIDRLRPRAWADRPTYSRLNPWLPGRAWAPKTNLLVVARELRDHLADLDAERVWQQLNRLVHSDDEPVLVTLDTPRLAGLVHRRTVAEWFELELDVVVDEIGPAATVAQITGVDPWAA